jgi:hypothetical protein
MYNMIFMDMLPRSSDAALELRTLGLDPGYAKYSGWGAFAPSTTFWDVPFQDQLDRNVTRFTIVRYYLDNPRRFLGYLQNVLPRGASLLRTIGRSSSIRALIANVATPAGGGVSRNVSAHGRSRVLHHGFRRCE